MSVQESQALLYGEKAFKNCNDVTEAIRLNLYIHYYRRFRRRHSMKHDKTHSKCNDTKNVIKGEDDEK